VGKLSAIHEARGEVVRIGRDPGSDIVLSDLRVSRRHAELRRLPDGSIELADAGSRAGTFLNGQRVDRARLSELDRVSIGAHLLRFREGKLEEYVDTGEAWFEGIGLAVRTPEGKVLLDDVTFSLEPRSLLAIVGPSGAGKSTLMNALTGFRPAETGFVLYGGRDLYEHYEELRTRIGYVPQEDILHPQLSVRRALTYAAHLRFPADVDRSTRTRRVEEVMAELGLSERADLPIEKLSGGQRKRTSIALELLTRPALLFLDEPTSGLDPGNEAHVMDLLRQLADGGRIVIVVTHSVQSLHVCDRVLFMAPGGKVAYFGPAQQAERFFASHRAGQAYTEVFRALEEDRERDWQAQFRSDPAHETYVRRSVAFSEVRRGGQAERALPPAPPQRWGSQFWVLVRRYLSVLWSDRRTLLLLGLQAPVFGLLYILMLGKNVMNTRHGIMASLLVWLLVMAVTWMGTSNAIREIVKEFPIYRRERSVGLSISAYVASKILVLGAITAIQAVVLVLIITTKQKLPPVDTVGVFQELGRPPPTTGSVLGSATGEFALDIVLAGLAAMALGLVVSAILRSAERALVVLPLIFVIQLVVSIPLLPQGPALKAAGYVSSARWGTAATASTVSLNELRAPYIAGLTFGAVAVLGPDAAKEATRDAFRQEWDHTTRAWTLDTVAVVVLILVPLLAAAIVLRLRDATLLMEAPARAGPAPPANA
jgi:ABC-type multidrug transport system ATPase subunit